MNYTDISKLFQDIEKTCFICFRNIYMLRESLSKGEISLSYLEAIETIFKEQKQICVRCEKADKKVILELLEKVEMFYSSHIFFIGSKQTKGKVDFFEYAKANPKQTGMLMKYLSVMNKNMEIAWFGILQKYGKAMIHTSKDIGKK